MSLKWPIVPQNNQFFKWLKSKLSLELFLKNGDYLIINILNSYIYLHQSLLIST